MCRKTLKAMLDNQWNFGQVKFWSIDRWTDGHTGWQKVMHMSQTCICTCGLKKNTVYGEKMTHESERVRKWLFKSEKITKRESEKMVKQEKGLYSVWYFHMLVINALLLDQYRLWWPPPHPEFTQISALIGVSGKDRWRYRRRIKASDNREVIAGCRMLPQVGCWTGDQVPRRRGLQQELQDQQTAGEKF